jgi:hypothetical protein
MVRSRRKRSGHVVPTCDELAETPVERVQLGLESGEMRVLALW